VVWPQNHWVEFLGLASKPRLTVCQWFCIKTTGSGFLVWPQNHGRRFVGSLTSKPLGWVFGLDLKTGNYSVVIQTSKSPRRFHGLSLKTMWNTVCRLHHKTIGRMKTVPGTHQDLAVFFTWKQVRLGFPSLLSRLVEAQRGWCTWHHHGGCIESKLKTDESMGRAASDPSTPTRCFLCIMP
jgi:hypothetical protein